MFKSTQTPHAEEALEERCLEASRTTKPTLGHHDMIMGNPARFAIETEITKALENPSHRALGFIVVHVAGAAFGVRAPEATLLGLFEQGVAGAVAAMDARDTELLYSLAAPDLVRAYVLSIYAPTEPADLFQGKKLGEWADTFQKCCTSWAANADEAFDDGTHLLQTGSGETARFVAFRHLEELDSSLATIKEICLPKIELKEILQAWLDAFRAEHVRRLPRDQLAGIAKGADTSDYRDRNDRY